MALVDQLEGGAPPSFDAPMAKATFAAVHRAISAGAVRACHDLSEGGLAVAIAEMAFAGGRGATIQLDALPKPMDNPTLEPHMLLFSESNTRFLCEVAPDRWDAFGAAMAGVPHARIGVVTSGNLRILASDAADVAPLVDADPRELKAVWQAPLAW